MAIYPIIQVRKRLLNGHSQNSPHTILPENRLFIPISQQTLSRIISTILSTFSRLRLGYNGRQSTRPATSEATFNPNSFAESLPSALKCLVSKVKG
jgi:hypothetical protein